MDIYNIPYDIPFDMNFSSLFQPLHPGVDSVTIEDGSFDALTSLGVGLGTNGSLVSSDIKLPISNVTDANIPKFNFNSLTVVIVYCILFLIAAVGNLTVFITLFKSRRRKSRISLMISHLAIADLMVTFVMIPLEIGWRITVKWMAGNLACKAFLFLRAFGLYLSSNVLVCVSLDRYFAVLHPLRVTDARRRGRMMLYFAWGVSFVCSFPQSFVFHVSPHPDTPDFEQCVSFGFFNTPAQETAYNLFCVSAMYFIPLFIIVVAYSCILCEISKKSRETKDITYPSKGSRLRLRRSDIRNIERARSRTLRMTVTIVSVFVWCWLPYTVMTLWYMFDRESARKVDSRLQDFFFIMAVSNSCMNPLVYGSYAMNFRRETARCCGCLFPRSLDRKSTGLQTKGGLIRRLVQYAHTIYKVGSGATRSTGTCNNIRRLPNLNGNTKPKQVRQELVTVGPVPFMSESSFAGYRTSFHSDPSPQPEDFHKQDAELSRTMANQGLLTTRSLDNAIAIGYRRCGHQTRWR